MAGARHILLVDDEPDIRTLVRLSLRRSPALSLTAVGTAAEARAALAAGPVDGVLLDVMLPGQGGPALLAELRANAGTRGLPIILFTGATADADLFRYAQLGATGVISKPFDPLTLGAQIERLLVPS